MEIIPALSSKCFTKDTKFTNDLLIMDEYYKPPIIYGMENIDTEEVMDKLDMFQARFWKVEEFIWWGLEWIQTDAVNQFNSKYFQGSIYVRGVKLTLASPDHQEINDRVEVTWRKFLTIAHSIKVHTRV